MVVQWRGVWRGPSRDAPHRTTPGATALDILLEGLTGAYNAGAEGIIRGTVRILKECLPDARPRFVSRDPVLDRAVLADLDLTILDGRARLDLPRRVVNRAARALTGAMAVRPEDPVYHHARAADCVLSVGGDLYTLWPNEVAADRFQLVERTRRLLEACPRFVLWGASVGPFDRNPAAVRAFREVLGRMGLILAREPGTVEYLEGLDLGDRVCPVGDPAFLMDPVDPDDPVVAPLMPESDGQTLGVNLSPFSVHHALDRGQIETMQERFARQLAVHLDERPGLRLLLIPHVETPGDPTGDDHGFLEAVRDRLPERHAGRVRLLPRGLRARRLKRLIGGCSALVAARMHCAIAGVSMGVPTLLLSYSAKARGMARYVYGDDRWVLPVDAEPEAFGRAVRDLLGAREALRPLLHDRVPRARVDAMRAGEALKSLLRPMAAAIGD